jgi:sterol desaturase/sphingolipid hydroxylase (fatty acid hydroxylase superfamily)
MSASPRLFENPLLDRLSRVHWSLPLFIYLPVVALLIVSSLSSMPGVSVLMAVALGYVIWTLTEYFGHRYLFHWEFPGQFGARIHFLIHGVHHIHPNDPLRLVMPALLSGPIMLLAFIITRSLFGASLALPVLAGFLSGYLIYDMVHYYVHHAEPRTALGRFYRRFHLMHHFNDPTRGFGVSAPWWDFIFKTQFIRQRARRSA